MNTRDTSFPTRNCNQSDTKKPALPQFWSSPSEAKTAKVAPAHIDKIESSLDVVEYPESKSPLGERIFESSASRRLHRLIYCDGRLHESDSCLASDWHSNRQRFLGELENLLRTPPTVHHSYRGHFLLVYQLLGLDRTEKSILSKDPLRNRSRTKKQTRLAIQLLQQIGSLQVPIAAPSSLAEEDFMERMLTAAESTRGESFLHQPPLNKASKRLTEAFNTLTYTLHMYLHQSTDNLRDKSCKKRYRKVWSSLSHDPHLRAHYHHFIRCWSEFTHLYLIEKACQSIRLDSPQLSRLLRSAAVQWAMSTQEPAQAAAPRMMSV
jgi:hypothetical protein